MGDDGPTPALDRERANAMSVRDLALATLLSSAHGSCGRPQPPQPAPAPTPTVEVEPSRPEFQYL